MNVVSRGIRNALRSPVRSGAIIIMLAISIGLILTMLVARTSVNAKIDDIKATVGTTITVSPTGTQGGLGGGDAITTDQVKLIAATPHVAHVTSTLADQLSTDDTNLQSSIELGNLGKRQLRFESRDGSLANSSSLATKLARTTITGSSDPSSTITSDKITSGATIDGNSSDTIAMIGSKLAQKNNLAIGSTFTAYGKTITVKTIYTTGNMFQDSAIIVPLATLQTLTAQPGAVSSVTVTADSSDDVASLTNTLKSTLGDKVDVVSQQDQIDNTVKPLENIAQLALAGVIAAAIAASVIILLAMVMIVRERRREIGVIKAIGGTNAKVIVQFMVEALTLTIISGVVGLALGVAASGPMTQSLVQNAASTTGTSRSMNGPRLSFGGTGLKLDSSLRNVTSTLTPQAFAISAGIILLIAIIGSAVPAWVIARVRPAEVLRAE